MLTVLHGDALSKLAEIESESVQTCVTSPPYWGLRDYGTATWEGGDADCLHDQRRAPKDGKQSTNEGSARDRIVGEFCRWCRARRVDVQIGLEKTPDEYVARLVEIFREVKRVLRSDGTIWLNLGDSYAGSGAGGGGNRKGNEHGQHDVFTITGRPDVPLGLKQKDLVGIPWALAKALRDPYYSGRILREVDRVWMAATLDAEGTICGFTHERKDDGSIRTGVHITITNTSTLMLDNAERIWPASRSEHQRHGDGHLGDLNSYRWIVHGIENKMLFLREIYPYLIVKRRQAALAFNLLLLMADAKRLGHSPQKESVWEKRALLVGLMSDANKSRSCDVPPWCVEPPSLHEQGWYLRSDIIWSKPNPMPESVTDRPTKSHEYIFLLSKGAKYYYDAESIAELAEYDGRKDEQFKGSVKNYDDVMPNAKPHSFAQNGHPRWKKDDNGNRVKNRRSVWRMSTQSFSDAHFATFPPELPRLCILAGSKHGDLVLDPFAGSGTTGKVAIELGRRAVLIEPKSEYVAMIERRCQTTIGLPL